MKISKILHLAADKYLYDGGSLNDTLWGKMTDARRFYSCDAIRDACYEKSREWLIDPAELVEQIDDGLYEMGLDVNSHVEFDEFESIAEQQGARYLWLKWAALMAEEQGM